MGSITFLEEVDKKLASEKEAVLIIRLEIARRKLQKGDVAACKKLVRRRFHSAPRNLDCPRLCAHAGWLFLVGVSFGCVLGFVCPDMRCTPRLRSAKASSTTLPKSRTSSTLPSTTCRRCSTRLSGKLRTSISTPSSTVGSPKLSRAFSNSQEPLTSAILATCSVRVTAMTRSRVHAPGKPLGCPEAGPLV